jgi:hypothetical protein
MPRPVGRPGETRKQAALSRIKVRPSQLQGVAPISEILKETPNGIKSALKAMRFSQSHIVRKFLHKWDRIPDRDRAGLTLEAVAIAAKVDPTHLLGEIMLAMREYSVQAVKIIGITQHPEVMQKSINNALTSEGVKDREMVHTMLGALAPRGGATFIDKFFAGRQVEPEKGDTPAPVAPSEMVDDLEYLFPSSSSMQERIQPMRNRLLGAGK